MGSALIKAMLGENGHPLEAEYNPFQAGVIAAGAGSQGAIDQIRKAYYVGKRHLADHWNFPRAGEDARGRIAEIDRRRAEENKIYAPLKSAYPYTTTLAETVPAVVGGPASMARYAMFNLGREYLGEVAGALEKEMPGDGSKSMQVLVDALRKF